MVVDDAVNETLFRERRDYQAGDPEAVPVLVDLWRSDMIVEAAVVIVCRKYGDGVPVAALSQVIDDVVRHGILAHLDILGRMLIAARRPDDPRYLTELASLDVLRELARSRELCLGGRRVLDISEALVPVGEAVDLPGDAGLVELLEYRRKVQRLRDLVVNYPARGSRNQRARGWNSPRKFCRSYPFSNIIFRFAPLRDS